MALRSARPSWQGHLRLSLVTCPVALYPAVSEAETVRFNLINPETNNRIRMKTVDAGTGDDVARSDLVKGYQVAKNEYVILDKEDFESVKLESTKIIDIEKFVPRTSIDRLYWDVPYHLVPDGKTGTEAFAVIREAMNQKRMVALGRLVMSTRERICAIEVEDTGLLMTTLRTAEVVRDAREFTAPELPKPDPRMLDIAGKIIEQLAGDFDPGEFKDRYEEALRAVIEQKMKGRPVKPSVQNERDSKVVDLMAALRASLGDAPRKPLAAKPLIAKPRAANRNSREAGRPAKPTKRRVA